MNQARQWRTSSQWTFVQCVHCAANIVTCDIPDIVHCANSLPVLCPAGQPSATHQIETQNLFHSFTLSTESQNSNHQVGFFLFFQVLIWYCLNWAKLKKHMHQRHSMGSSRLKQVSMSLQTFLIPTFQLLHPKIHMDHIMVMMAVIIMMNILQIVTMIDSDWMVRVQVTGREISFRHQRPAASHLDTGSKPIFGRGCTFGFLEIRL